MKFKFYTFTILWLIFSHVPFTLGLVIPSIFLILYDQEKLGQNLFAWDLEHIEH